MRALLPALAWVALLAGALPAARAELQPCRIDGHRFEVMCGSVRRPLDPARPDGPAIDVRYVVVPALARRKFDDPVFLIPGGPGQSASSVLSQVLPLFQRLNNRRDIVFVDQRGTGRSEPLDCEDPRHQAVADQADPERQFRQLLACRDRLGARPNLGGVDGLKFFSTPLAMQDLDAVRAQLGADRINLVGASYGTRAALDYLRQFPRHVRRVVLDGVAPPDMVLPASQSVDSQAVLDALLESCAREPGCQADFPDLRQDWARLLSGLPRPVEVTHPVTGRPERLTLTRDMVLSTVRGALYAPVLSSALPAALHDAAAGRFDGLTGLGSSLFSGKSGAIAAGMHFSVVCAEDVPRLAGHAEGRGKDFGDGQLQLYRRVCAAWPRGTVPEAFYTVPPSPAPVLLLSGGLDPATPPRHGERVATALGSNARHVVVDNAGHGLLALGCLRDTWFRFIDAPDDATALRVDTFCAKGVPRPPALRPVRLPAEAAR
ncbi:MAG: alpha/beta fold hydrolase [Rhizobacter sp.]